MGNRIKVENPHVQFSQKVALFGIKLRFTIYTPASTCYNEHNNQILPGALPAQFLVCPLSTGGAYARQKRLNDVRRERMAENPYSPNLFKKGS